MPFFHIIKSRKKLEVPKCSFIIRGNSVFEKRNARASERTFLSILILILLMVLLLLLHLLPRVEDGTVDGVEIGEEGIVVVVVVVVAERRFVFAEEEAQERLAE